MRDFCISEAVSLGDRPGQANHEVLPVADVPGAPRLPVGSERPSIGNGWQIASPLSLGEDDVGLIRGSDFFHHLGAPELADLMRLCRIRVLGPGRTVFRQADDAKSFFLVLEGWLKVTKLTATGELMVRRIVKAGGTLAEASAFCDGLCPGTAESLTEVRLLEVPLAGVVEAMGGPQSLAFNIVIGMAKQAERMAGRLEEAFHFTAPQRLAAFLIGIFPSSAARMSTLLPYDKCLLALSLGMTPETLSRAFQALRSLGVRTHNREIFVEDVQSLRRYCGLDD